jgi:DNA mismatch repair protein MutL
VDDVAGPVRTVGLIERPSDVGTATRRVYVTVTGRAVRDAGVVRAAELAYRSTVPAGLRPTLFLSVELPGDLVDVNVHPAKAEVRFRDRWPVERAVESAVRRALGTVASAPSLGVRVWPAAPPGAAPVPVDVEVLRPPPAAGALFPVDAAVAVADAPASERVAIADEPPVPPLLQLRRTYILFERDEGVVLIDQHSAHERVLFEQFMRQLEGGEAPSQRLLFPLTLHLGPAEGDAFDASRPALERLGFEVESFGGHTLLVRAVPAPHPRFDAERCLRDTLAALSGARDAGSAARHEQLAATVACKAAIKAGDALSSGEMRALYLALGRTTLPAHDVHGRSTIVQLGWDELERRFGRR